MENKQTNIIFKKDWDHIPSTEAIEALNSDPEKGLEEILTLLGAKGNWSESPHQKGGSWVLFLRIYGQKRGEFLTYIDLRGKSIRKDGLKEGGGFNGATARTT